MPRIPPVDEDGRLVLDWRQELARGRDVWGVLWAVLALLEFIALYVIIREMLPESAFEPHLDTRGVLFVWIILSSAFTALTLILLTRLMRKVRQFLASR